MRKPVYVLEQEELDKLREIEKSLCGNDTEKLFGARIKAVLDNIDTLPERFYEMDRHGNISWS